MNDLVLATTVHTQLAIKSMVERLRQNERGASALEYVGMLIIGAVFVSAIYGVIKPEKIKSWVDKATSVMAVSYTHLTLPTILRV